jgi:hypothetical protein
MSHAITKFVLAIAAEAGLKDRRGAQRIVRRLEKMGVIVAETSKAGGRLKSTHYRFNLNSVPTTPVSRAGNSGPTDAVSPPVNSDRTTAVSPAESATVEVQEQVESATVEVGNSDPGGHKQRSYSRTKGYETLLNDPTAGALGNSGANAPGKKPSATPRKPQTPFPKNFVPNDENRAVASKHGVDLDKAFEAFKHHHMAKDSRFADWHAALNS